MRISVAKWGILGIALNLVGCFSARSCSDCFELSRTDLCENVEQSLASSSFIEGDYPNRSWWEIFCDPQLNCLVEIGLKESPNIKVAQARINLAYEEAIETRAKLLPYFDLLTSYSRQRESLYDIGIPAFVSLVEGDNLFFNTATTLLRGSYEVDIWSKNRNQYYSDLSLLQARMTEKAEAELILASAISKTYFNLQNHLTQREILAKQLKAKKEAYDLLNERFYRGMGDEFFVYIFDREVALIQDDLIQMEGMIEMDHHALAALVGQSVEIDTPTAHFEKRLQLPSTIPFDLLSRRPDVKSSLWMIQSKGYDVKVAKARFFPNLDLSAFVGSTAFLVSKFFSPSALKLFGDAASVLPLYTGGELRAKLGQSQASLDLSVDQYNQTVLLAVQEVSDAMTKLRTSDQRLIKVDRSVADSEALYDLSRQKYTHGIDTNIRVLNALSNVYIQQLLQSEIQLNRMISIVEVIRSIGGGYGA
ncbi:MAG: Outer membrane protein OprM [Chlamydiales bacterium]|nr:Outer membrane protein OprM [Chlamydiales bacterium]MCH9620051.1 Outer membrane protein OprM [Chlamydiales bacterium]MCH9623530.1 Outer membrane protein OprM [Chlamydiales bacterium]